MTWVEEYRAVLERLAGHSVSARLVFCGLSVCVDATTPMTEAASVLLAAQIPAAVALGHLLIERARAGVGGEIRVEWQGGPAWLDTHLAPKHSLGGTGPHAARILTMLGVPTLLAVATRSPEQMAVLDPSLRLASKDQVVRVDALSPTSENVPKIYIFEFTAGQNINGIVLPRSSRIIVRFTDPGIEDDRAFVDVSARLAPEAGAAILSGFNAIGRSDLGAPLARIVGLIATWKAAGSLVIHLELAGYDEARYRDRVLDEFAGRISSVGLSLSEFEALVPSDARTLPERMCQLGKRLGVQRLCVHADTWAATATLGNAETERESLLLGCLLASVRASHGSPRVPSSVPSDAVFAETPPFPQRLGRWNLVCVAAPYLKHPITTLGLGDTFTAGCLIVLSRRGSLKQEMPRRGEDAAAGELDNRYSAGKRQPHALYAKQR